MPDAKPVRLAAGSFLLLVCVVAGCAPCRVTQLTLGVTLQRSAAPPFPSGPCDPPGAPYQNTLGAVSQDPLFAKLRLDTNDALASFVRRRRYALKVPAAHFMWKLWMVRGRGGWGAGRRLAEGAVLQTIKYLLNCHLSSPPQRRGQGWWFAFPRSSAGR